LSRRYIARNPSRPFSDAVLIDEKTLYLSGRIGLKPGVDEVPDSIEEEAHLLLKDTREILALAGMTMDHFVSIQIFAPDITLWARFNEIYRQYFTAPLPPRAFIGSGPLLFGAHFEMQGIAVNDTITAP
jgi:2-iminobutanoate/2-iminopropanoate deaminase